jgi:hypothetical protein
MDPGFEDVSRAFLQTACNPLDRKLRRVADQGGLSPRRQEGSLQENVGTLMHHVRTESIGVRETESPALS